jgi:hypothetical protein
MCKGKFSTYCKIISGAFMDLSAEDLETRQALLQLNSTIFGFRSLPSLRDREAEKPKGIFRSVL